MYVPNANTPVWSMGLEKIYIEEIAVKKIN